MMYRLVFWSCNTNYDCLPYEHALLISDNCFYTLDEAKVKAVSVLDKLRSQFCLSLYDGCWALLCRDTLGADDGLVCSRLDYRYQWVDT